MTAKLDIDSLIDHIQFIRMVLIANSYPSLTITLNQHLLRLFGIPYIVAPMEAEAQCAELCRLSLADAIVSDDSDVFLFGGSRVYKNMFNNHKYVECYLASDIERELHLDRKRLIVLALLLGSDYAEGLQGVGVVTAMEILNEFEGEDMLVSFRDWWIEVQNGRDKGGPKESDFKRNFVSILTSELFICAYVETLLYTNLSNG